MISSRYALPVILLLALALIPTVIHSYFKLLIDDGRSVENIPLSFSDFLSKPNNQLNDRRVNGIFGSKDWIDRTYVNSSGVRIRLFVARSFDYKRLYHHPELGLSSGTDLRSEGVLMLHRKPEMPIHLFQNNDGRGQAGYVLLHEGDFIKEPLLYQISNALKQLVSARKAMTLFYVSSSNDPENIDFSDTSAAFILGESVKSFQALVPPLEVE